MTTPVQSGPTGAAMSAAVGGSLSQLPTWATSTVSSKPDSTAMVSRTSGPRRRTRRSRPIVRDVGVLGFGVRGRSASVSVSDVAGSVAGIRRIGGPVGVIRPAAPPLGGRRSRTGAGAEADRLGPRRPGRGQPSNDLVGAGPVRGIGVAASTATGRATGVARSRRAGRATAPRPTEQARRPARRPARPNARSDRTTPPRPGRRRPPRDRPARCGPGATPREPRRHCPGHPAPPPRRRRCRSPGRRAAAGRGHRTRSPRDTPSRAGSRADEARPSAAASGSTTVTVSPTDNPPRRRTSSTSRPPRGQGHANANRVWSSTTSETGSRCGWRMASTASTISRTWACDSTGRIVSATSSTVRASCARQNGDDRCPEPAPPRCSTARYTPMTNPMPGNGRRVGGTASELSTIRS